MLATLANYWALRGKTVCVITYNDSEEDFFVLDSKVRRIAIPPMKPSPYCIGRIFQNIRHILAIRRVLKKIVPKASIGFILSTNIRLILASFGLKSTIIISERNDPVLKSFRPMWKFLRKNLYKFADVVTANSKGALKTLSDYVPHEKLFLVPNPIHLSIRNDCRSAKGNKILTIGRLVHQKAHDILLNAFAGVADKNPDWHLTIVGEGPLSNELHCQAEKLGIVDRVTWLSNVRNPFNLYRQASIFVLVSRYEGTPNVLLEAMSCGLPVIVSDASPGPLEYVKHESTGLVVPVDNVPALEDSINRLIRDHKFRNRIGEAARERVAAYALPEVIKVWESVLGF